MCQCKNSARVAPIANPPPAAVGGAAAAAAAAVVLPAMGYAQLAAHGRATAATLPWVAATALPHAGNVAPRALGQPNPAVYDVPDNERAALEQAFGVQPATYAQIRVYTGKIKNGPAFYSHSFQSCVPVIAFYPNGSVTLWHLNGYGDAQLRTTVAQRGGALPDHLLVIGKGAAAVGNATHQARVGLLSESIAAIVPAAVQVTYVQVQTVGSLCVVVDGANRNVYAYNQLAHGADPYDHRHPDANEL